MVIVNSAYTTIFYETGEFINNVFLKFVEHSEFTDVDAVGLQIWDGALLLANFVIHEGNSLFCDKNILELSSGTGFVSIITAIYCKHVTCTGLEKLLSLYFFQNCSTKFLHFGIFSF